MVIDRIEFDKDEIIKIISSAKDFCVGLEFKSSDFLKDILSKVPLFTEDGLYFKWAHKSIQEYFAAQFIYTDSKNKQGKILSVISKSNTKKHFNIMDIYYSIDYKTFRRYVMYDFLKDYVKFYDFAKYEYKLSDEFVSLLFCCSLLFVRKKENFRSLSHIMEYLKPVNASSVNLRWTSYSSFLKRTDAFNYLRVFKGENNNNILTEFLYLKNSNLVSLYDTRNRVKDDRSYVRFDFTPKGNYKWFDLPYDDYRIIQKDSVDQFFDIDKLDGLLKSFVYFNPYIKYGEAKKVIREIEAEIIEEQSDDFLLKGLM